MAARHEEGCYCVKLSPLVISCLQRVIERCLRGGKDHRTFGDKAEVELVSKLACDFVQEESLGRRTSQVYIILFF